MKKGFISLVFIVFSLSNSWANHGVTVTPPSTNYVPGVTTLVNVLWNISNGLGSYSSTSASFTTLGGLQLGGFNSTINITCPNVVTPICTPRSEEFSIPNSVLNAVANTSVTSFLYKRTFFDTKNLSDQAVRTFQINLPVVPIVPVVGESNVVNNAQNNLKISREALFFNDRTTLKLVKKSSRLSAIAELNFTGTGLLDAVWEYATPTSTSGQAIFIRLGHVRRYLGVGGRIQLQSPLLPTDMKGQYVVRLNILKTLSNPNGVEFSDNLPDGLPLLRYTVRSNDKEGLLPPLKTLFPLNNAFLQKDTRFNWQAVKGAKAYQLELFSSNEQRRQSINAASHIKNQGIDHSLVRHKKPISGLLIPSLQTSLLLSALSKDALKPNQTYYWRIIAIGSNGKVLSVSELKIIKTP